MATKKSEDGTDTTLPVGDQSLQSAATTEVGSEDQGNPVWRASSHDMQLDTSRSVNGLRWDYHQALVAINPGPSHSEAVAQAQAALDAGDELPEDIRGLLQEAIRVHAPFAKLYDRARDVLQKYL